MVKATLPTTFLRGISLIGLSFVRAEVLTMRGRESVRWIDLLTTKGAGETQPAGAVRADPPRTGNMLNHKFTTIAGNFRSLGGLVRDRIAVELVRCVVNVAVRCRVFGYR